MSSVSTDLPVASPASSNESGTSFLEVIEILAARWRLLVVLPLLVGVSVAAITFVIQPTFTGRTTFLPPQTQQGPGAAALASFGALAGLASTGVRTPADQFAALLNSDVVRNRLIDQFDLVKVYDVPLRHDARKKLAENTRIAVGRRDGIITLEVDDYDATRAAEIANTYVEELRKLAARLALTEAQQRRAFFEAELTQTRDRLNRAQEELQRSGFSGQTLRADPKAAAENFVRLQAQLTAAEIRLQGLRVNLTDNAPEVVQQAALVTALRRELVKIEGDNRKMSNGDEQYISRYRDFRYQETMLEILARQYELARLDERRDGGSLQVIDNAQAPERRTSPKRGLMTISAVLISAAVLVVLILMHASFKSMSRSRRAA